MKFSHLRLITLLTYRYVDAKSTEEILLRSIRSAPANVLQAAKVARKELRALVLAEDEKSGQRFGYESFNLRVDAVFCRREWLIAIKDYQRRFTAPWVLVRRIFHGVEAAQRLRDYKTAVKLLAFLLFHDCKRQLQKEVVDARFFCFVFQIYAISAIHDAAHGTNVSR